MPAVGLAVAVLAATGLLLMTAGVFGDVGLAPVDPALFVLMSTMGVRPGVADGPAPRRRPARSGGRADGCGPRRTCRGARGHPLPADFHGPLVPQQATFGSGGQTASATS